MSKTKVNLTPDPLFKTASEKEKDQIYQAAGFIIEKEYVKQVPVDTGDLRKGVQVKKIGNRAGWVVNTNAVSDSGENYPEMVHEGTGVLKGLSDFGYTPGRVRAGKVISGLGGIRPNKFADRAFDKTEDKARSFIEEKMFDLIQK